MKHRIMAALLAALTFACLSAPARAACDYDIGGSSPFTMAQLESQLDEELLCIQAAIASGSVADGDKGDITVSVGGSVWTIDALSVAISTDVSGLATGIATFLGTPSSANLRSAITDETGGGALMFGLTPSMNDGLTCAASDIVRRNAGDTAFECAAAPGGGDALKADPLSQFAATTSTQLRGVLSDEVGTGFAMFGLVSTMADDLSCTASQVVRRNSGDTAFECATLSGTGDLLAANNLSDVANAATAFGNIKQPASTTATGVAEAATDAEALAKSDALRYLTPANLAAMGATTTFQGLCELATTAEAAAQTDTARCVTPQGLAFKPESFCVAASDETTNLTTGTAKVTFRMPYAFTVTAVRASVNTVSSSGLPTFDINEGGSTIISTKITIDASEKTSVTAATPPVISDSALADDAEMTIDQDVAGTGAKGAKVCIIGHQ